jgi:hypothetical protein
MAMWLRLAGALIITAAVMAALDYFGLRPGAGFGGRSPEDVQHTMDGRVRELFWFAVFAFVMMMSVVAAVRRWSGQLKRAMVPATSPRRDVP